MVTRLPQNQLEKLLHACPVGMMQLDEEGRVCWMNDGLKNLLGSRANYLHNCSMNEAPAELRPLFGADATVHLPANDEHDETWLLTTTYKLEDDAGVMQFFADATPLQQLIRERDALLAERAEYILVDEESGMPNRRALFQSLEPQVSRSRRYHNPLSVIIMRLLNLDTYQAAGGEDSRATLFTALRQLLNDKLRWADIIGRLDGAEILIVLPETIGDDALKLAAKIRQYLTELELPTEGETEFQLAAAFGATEWRKGDDVGLLMMRARQHLEKDMEKAQQT